MSQENKTSLTLSLGILPTTRLKEHSLMCDLENRNMWSNQGNGLDYFMLSPTCQIALKEGTELSSFFTNLHFQQVHRTEIHNKMHAAANK